LLGAWRDRCKINSWNFDVKIDLNSGVRRVRIKNTKIGRQTNRLQYSGALTLSYHRLLHEMASGHRPPDSGEEILFYGTDFGIMIKNNKATGEKSIGILPLNYTENLFQ
jgi:hypothetical protein